MNALRLPNTVSDGLSTEEVRAGITECRRCPLGALARCHTTWRPVGNMRAGIDVLFVGEAPGEVEDACGVPFVGSCGQHFQSEWIPRLQLREDQYLVTNSVHCWPRSSTTGKTRPPSKKEQTACREWLLHILRLTKPKVVVAMGRSAATALSGAGVSGFLEAKHPGYYIRGNPWERELDVLRLQISSRLMMSTGPNAGNVAVPEW